MDEHAEPTELASKAIDKLALPDSVREILTQIQAEVSGAYRQGFLEMIQVMKQQASAIERIQGTLNVLVENLAPSLTKNGNKLPVAFALSSDSASSDLAKAVVVADPIAAGFTLTQSDLAKVLKVSQTDVSILIKAFGMKEEAECAVVVRSGPSSEMVNYHARATVRFLELVESPPKGMSRDAMSALKRARAQLAGPVSQK